MAAKYPQVLLANRKADRVITLQEYEQSGGYQGLKAAIGRYDRGGIQQMLEAANLVGRGGAAFPAGLKLKSVAADAPFPRYIVCNADEMEPGTFKDRVLIHTSPHMIIEGIIIAGYAIQAEKGVIFIRPEYESGARILEREVKAAETAGYLGKNILGSHYALEIAVHRSGGRYICGEVTAQLNALMGKRPNPMKPPPYPTEKGVWGLPTVLSNVETFACMPHILRRGPEWFKGLAKTKAGAGTKIFCVSGKVNRPGCYELPMGVRLREIIEDHAGGLSAGSQYKACLPGGASTGFLSEEHLDVEMDFESLKKVGNRLGTGAIMVFDHKTCLVAATLNLTAFFARESCGWCTPCREGLPYIRDLLLRLENGEGEEDFIPMLEEMGRYLWNAYCAFAPGAVAPLQSLLTHFRGEVEDHIRLKRCPFKSNGPLNAQNYY
jgi:NADH-quinone oxidoreductase subunit F